MVKSKKASIDILLVWNGMVSSQVSGGDIFTKKLIELSGYRFDLVLTEQARKLVSFYKPANLTIVDNKLAVGNFKIMYLYLSRALRSLRHTRSKKYDLAIASSPFICDVLPISLTKTDNRAVVLFHVLPRRKSKNLVTATRFFFAAIEQKVCFIFIKYRFQTILAGNQELKQALQQRFPDKKIVVADAGIDTHKINSLTHNQAKDPDLGVFVGRLTSQKGILDLVDVVKEVIKERPKFRLLVIGDGPERQQLVEKIEGLSSIELLGFVGEKQKYDILSKAKFFLFPSYEEGWGIALAEALYCESLCFCYEITHYRGLFSNYPIYVKMGEKHNFAKAILRNYNKMPDKKQKDYVARYEDKNVIKSVFEQLGLS